MSIDTLFNPFTGKLQLTNKIPQVTSDPSSPLAEDAWILATISGGSGGGKLNAFFGAFPYISPNTGGTASYQFSFRTLEGTTKRATLA